MSVFVAIPSIGNETEIYPTMQSLLRMATFPKDVHIGVSIVGNKDSYNFLKNEFCNNPNIKILFTDYKDDNGNYNIGVGLNRNLAASLYDGQDFFLQIDSHSRMLLGWDAILIEKILKAKKIVNNERVVLTGTPARYTYEKHGETTFLENYYQQFTGISYWDNKEKWRYNETIPRWSHRNLLEHTDENLIKMDSTYGLLPAAKICAAFIFGDTTFALNYSLSKDVVFWEEEIFHSIELINNGFTLVHSGSTPIVSHLYSADINYGKGTREGLFDVLFRLSGKNYKDAETLYIEKMLDSWNKYMDDPNNQHKIKVFEDYNNFSFKEVIHDLYTYPKDYINRNFLPLPKDIYNI